MRVSNTGRTAARRVWQDLPNLLSLLLFFTATAAIFRSLEFALVVTASLGFHEIGHAGAISWFGLPWRIRFGVVGAWTWSPGEERARLSQLDNLMIHLSGPLFSLLLSLLALAIHRFWLNDHQRLLVLANFSAQVAFINLLPLGPVTDGGKAVQRMMISLDQGTRWLAVVLPVGVTGLMMAIYWLVQAPHMAQAKLAPILLGLLLIGLWFAGSLFLESRLNNRAQAGSFLPIRQPMTARQVYFMILVMWDLMALALILVSATPFWLEPQYLIGYLENLFSIFNWLVRPG